MMKWHGIHLTLLFALCGGLSSAQALEPDNSALHARLTQPSFLEPASSQIGAPTRFSIPLPPPASSWALMFCGLLIAGTIVFRRLDGIEI